MKSISSSRLLHQTPDEGSASTEVCEPGFKAKILRPRQFVSCIFNSHFCMCVTALVWVEAQHSKLAKAGFCTEPRNAKVRGFCRIRRSECRDRHLQKGVATNPRESSGVSQSLGCESNISQFCPCALAALLTDTASPRGMATCAHDVCSSSY